MGGLGEKGATGGVKAALKLGVDRGDCVAVGISVERAEREGEKEG